MKITLNGREYDLYNDLDRSNLEYLASLAVGKPTLQEYLLQATGVDISPAVASESQIEAFDQTYDMNNEQDYQAYVKRLRAAEKARVAKLHKEIDERIETANKQEDKEPATKIPKETKELSPQMLRYYQLKDEQSNEDPNQRTRLAEWANNFGDLAQKNYDNRLRKGDELAKQAETELAQERFRQFFKDDKMMSVIEGKTPTASNRQVPNFDPSSANLNTGGLDRPGVFDYDPNMEDFSRNNTVPMEVVARKEIFGF